MLFTQAGRSGDQAVDIHSSANSRNVQTSCEERGGKRCTRMLCVCRRQRWRYDVDNFVINDIAVHMRLFLSSAFKRSDHPWSSRHPVRNVTVWSVPLLCWRVANKKYSRRGARSSCLTWLSIWIQVASVYSRRSAKSVG